MSKARLSDADRLTAVNAEISRLQTRAKELAAAPRAKDTRTAQRRAFLIGEAISADSELSASFKTQLASILDRHVTRPGDRDLLRDLLGLATPETSESDEAAA